MKKKILVSGHGFFTTTLFLGEVPKFDPIQEIEPDEICQQKFGIDKIYLCANREDAERIFEKQTSKFHK